jgi:hypothetical protein
MSALQRLLSVMVALLMHAIGHIAVIRRPQARYLCPDLLSLQSSPPRRCGPRRADRDAQRAIGRICLSIQPLSIGRAPSAVFNGVDGPKQ